MTDMISDGVRAEGIDDTPAHDVAEGTAYTDTQGIPSESTHESENATQGGIDYGALMESDVAELREEFPELNGIKNITQLNNPLRYAALRDLGLSPAEAYLATARRHKGDTRSHLKSAHGRNAARSTSGMSYVELTMARDLFPGKNDAELERLYKRVTK